MTPHALYQTEHVHHYCQKVPCFQSLIWWYSKAFNGYTLAYIKEKIEITGVS